MSKKTKKDHKHVIMDTQNNEFRCTHCGGYKAVNMPIKIGDFTRMSDKFIAAHSGCQPAVEKPDLRKQAEKTIEIDSFIIRWLAIGERGTSSNTIVQYLTGMKTTCDFGMSHPHDPDDLSRCRKLLEQCPSIRDNFHLMRTCSQVWSNLVDRWQELCDLMDHEAPDWDKGRGSAPQTYDLMKRIGC